MMELDWGNRDPRWAGVSSDSVTIDGAKLHVLRADPDSVGSAQRDPDALPILLVHGLGGSATNWLEIMGGLARHTTVVAVDLPGFGDSRHATGHASRMLPQTTFLTRLLDTLGWDRAEVHGNSMGGFLSIMLAGTNPDRVARLVLVSPAYPSLGNVGVTRHMKRASTLTFMMFKVSRVLGLAVLRKLKERSTPEQVVAELESNVLPTGQQLAPAIRKVTLLQAMDAHDLDWRSVAMSYATSDLTTWLLRGWPIGRAGELEAATLAVTADTMLVWGDQDPLVKQVSMDHLTTLRSDIVRHDLAGVGHVAMIEVPDRYVTMVDTWRTALATA